MYLMSLLPGTGEPGRLPSMGSHRVGHNCSDLAAAAVAMSLHPSSMTLWQTNLLVYKQS